MHLKDWLKRIEEYEKEGYPFILSDEEEKNRIEFSMDMYLHINPEKIKTTQWPFIIEEINPNKFLELEKWKDLWRFTLEAKVKQTDKGEIIHSTENLTISGNFEPLWIVKSNPLNPNDKEWFPEVKNLIITNIERSK